MKDRDVLKYRGTLKRLLLLLLIFPVALQADVYKWVDENGIVSFSNIAPPTNQNYQVLKFPCYASDPKCRSIS